MMGLSCIGLSCTGEPGATPSISSDAPTASHSNGRENDDSSSNVAPSDSQGTSPAKGIEAATADQSRQPRENSPPTPSDAGDVIATIGDVEIIARPRFSVSKETTYIEGPLTDEGYVDYLAAINAQQSEGVTPQNNAAVILWRCIDPAILSQESRERFFAALGTAPPPATDEYLITGVKFCRVEGTQEVDMARVNRLNTELTKAISAPWNAKRLPLVAQWIAANERPLEVAATASKRSRYYQPIVADEPYVLMCLQLPGANEVGDMARLLVARAMLRIEQNDMDGAWQDIVTVYRLMRLLGQGHSATEGMLSAIFQRRASEATIELLKQFDPTLDQVRQMEADLRALPQQTTMAHKIDRGERFLYLDATMALARYGPHRFEEMVNQSDRESNSIRQFLGRLGALSLDWDQALVLGNGWYDRLANASRGSTYVERSRERSRMFDELEEVSRRANNRVTNIAIVTLTGRAKIEAASSQVSLMMVSMMLPPLIDAPGMEDRQLATFDVARVALALAACKSEQGKFPRSLDELVPNYISEVPPMHYTGKPLFYMRLFGGYSLASSTPIDSITVNKLPIK
jgi:hypothetical protein